MKSLAWAQEIEELRLHAQHFALSHKATAIIGVAVDDVEKRDYFVERLQKILDENTWARHLTFLVVPVMGGEFIDLKAKPTTASDSTTAPSD